MKKHILAITSLLLLATISHGQNWNDWENRRGRFGGRGHQPPTQPFDAQGIQRQNTASAAQQLAAIASDISQKASVSDASIEQLQAAQNQLLQISQQLTQISRSLENLVPPGICAVMYTNPNFSGIAVPLRAGEAIYNLSGININGRWENLNDQISSVAVGRNCTLQMWEHKNFGGRSDGFNSAISQVQMDNYYTSAKCFCNY